MMRRITDRPRKKTIKAAAKWALIVALALISTTTICVIAAVIAS